MIWVSPEFPPRVPDAHDRAAHLRLDALERTVAELREEFGDMRDTMTEMGHSMTAVTTDTKWIRAGLNAQLEDIGEIKRAIRDHSTSFDRHKITANANGNLSKALGVIASLVGLLAAAFGFGVL